MPAVNEASINNNTTKNEVIFFIMLLIELISVFSPANIVYRDYSIKLAQQPGQEN